MVSDLDNFANCRSNLTLCVAKETVSYICLIQTLKINHLPLPHDNVKCLGVVQTEQSVHTVESVGNHLTSLNLSS